MRTALAFVLGVGLLGLGGAGAVACSSNSTDPGTSSGTTPDAANPGDDAGGGNDGPVEPVGEGTLLFSEDNRVFKVAIAQGAVPKEILSNVAEVTAATADGTQIAYLLKGADKPSLHIANIDGTNDKLIAPDVNFEQPVPASDGNIYMTNRTPREIQVISTAGGSFTKWAGSPTTTCIPLRLIPTRDRTKIAWVARDSCPDTEHGYFIAQTNASAPVTLVKPAGLLVIDENYALDFTPAGDRLVFYAPNDTGPALYSMNLDGSDAKTYLQLPSETGNVQQIAISKNGKWAYIRILKLGIRRVSIDPPGNTLENVPGLPDKNVYDMVLID